MKILRIVLILGGLSLVGYGLYTAFFSETAEALNSNSGGMNNQLIGMIGVGLLAAVAGFFMRRRR